MKVEYMESFVQATCSVLRQVSGSDATPGLLDLRGTTFPAASINVAAKVDGSLYGEVVYSMSASTAAKLAGLVTGHRVHGFSRLTGQGLSQFGGMVAERTGTLLAERGLACEIGGSIIFQGLSVEFSVTAPALAVSIGTGLGQIDVNVAVTNGKQA